jgi:hypothetical protein
MQAIHGVNRVGLPPSVGTFLRICLSGFVQWVFEAESYEG